MENCKSCKEKADHLVDGICLDCLEAKQHDEEVLATDAREQNWQWDRMSNIPASEYMKEDEE